MNPNDIEAELSRRSLLSFATRLQPNYESPKHIQILAELLEDLEAGRIRRLALALPPRHGKSLLASVTFTAWLLGRNPKREVILASHSQELATGFSRQAKSFVESPLWPFDKVELSEDSRAIHRWNTTSGGGLFAVGVGGGVTGRGADFLIVDDSVDRPGQADLDKAWEWFRSIAFPRTNANARVLVIGARMAQDDLFGHLSEADDADEWTFVSLPAVNTADNQFGLAVGEPLWPERFGHDELKARREAMGLGPYTSQYLQDPSVAAGSGIFRVSDFGDWESLPRIEPPAWDPLWNGYISPLLQARPDTDSAFVKITACDFAGVENASSGGSYSAVVTVLSDLRDGSVYVLDCERHRGLEFFDLRTKVLLHLARHGPNLVVIESNDATGGRMIGDLSRTTAYPIRPVKPKTSKAERALQVIGMVESGKVFIKAKAAWRDAFLSELASFGHGCRYSDQTDALVWALLATRQYIAARTEDRFFEEQMERLSLFR